MMKPAMVAGLRAPDWIISALPRLSVVLRGPHPKYKVFMVPRIFLNRKQR